MSLHEAKIIYSKKILLVLAHMMNYETLNARSVYVHAAIKVL